MAVFPQREEQFFSIPLTTVKSSCFLTEKVFLALCSSLPPNTINRSVLLFCFCQNVIKSQLRLAFVGIIRCRSLAEFSKHCICDSNIFISAKSS